jgi:predicted transcriptional regulator
VDRVVVGVDSLENIKELIVSSTQDKKVQPIMEELTSFREEDEQIILPVNWK